MNELETVNAVNLDISTQELLGAERAITYADLYAMIEDEKTVAWLIPHTTVVRAYGEGACACEQLDESCHFSFSVDGKGIKAFARSHEHL